MHGDGDEGGDEVASGDIIGREFGEDFVGVGGAGEGFAEIEQVGIAGCEGGCEVRAAVHGEEILDVAAGNDVVV